MREFERVQSKVISSKSSGKSSKFTARDLCDDKNDKKDKSHGVPLMKKSSAMSFSKISNEENSMEVQSETRSETQTETRSETKSETQTEKQTETQSEVQSEVQSKSSLMEAVHMNFHMKNSSTSSFVHAHEKIMMIKKQKEQLRSTMNMYLNRLEDLPLDEKAKMLFLTNMFYEENRKERLSKLL